VNQILGLHGLQIFETSNTGFFQSTYRPDSDRRTGGRGSGLPDVAKDWTEGRTILEMLLELVTICLPSVSTLYTVSPQSLSLFCR
jgi:hypothetical protein